MPFKVFLRGFSPDIPEDQLVTFSNNLPDSVLCIRCTYVSSKLYECPCGHRYCSCCKLMCTAEDGFNCSTCDRTFGVEKLALDDTIRSQIIKEKVVCPHTVQTEAIEIPFPALKAHLKGCCCKTGSPGLNPGQQYEVRQIKARNTQDPAQASFSLARDNPSSLKAKLACPLCGSLEDRKALGVHMNEKCSKRVVECKFCSDDIEAWESKIHEASCRQRPGKCEHCLKLFSTVAELEDVHHPKCPEIPVNCIFHQLGCPFVAPRRKMTSHDLAATHAGILVSNISQLKAENERLRRTIETRKETYKKIIQTMLEATTEPAISGASMEVRLANVEESLREWRRLLQQIFLA